MSVNQDDNTLVERKKRQIPELPKEYGFLDEKVQTLKSNRSNSIVEITCNINKISKYLNSKKVERDKIYLCIELCFRGNYQKRNFQYLHWPKVANNRN